MKSKIQTCNDFKVKHFVTPGVRQYLHRMVVCLDNEILPFVPVAMESLMKNADAKELYDFIPLINQLVCKFKVRVVTRLLPVYSIQIIWNETKQKRTWLLQWNLRLNQIVVVLIMLLFICFRSKLFHSFSQCSSLWWLRSSRFWTRQLMKGIKMQQVINVCCNEVTFHSLLHWSTITFKRC